MSAAGFKREIPERVSKKFIRRKLHEKGYKYRRIKPKPKKASNDRYEYESLPETISFIAQALGEYGESIFFLDKVKFPLHSTGEYCWVKDAGNIMFNDRLDNMTLHFIALCSKNGFVAFQIFLDEITATDVLYFLTEFLRTYVTAPNMMILLDNAAWHKAEILRLNPVYMFLWFNAPKVFEVNLIENSFSAIKTEFKTRKVHEHLLDEVQKVFVPPIGD